MKLICSVAVVALALTLVSCDKPAHVVLGPAIEDQSPRDQHEFELVQLGAMRRDQFLLDKKTGRVWEKICHGEVKGPDCNGEEYWSEVYVEGLTGDDSPTSRYHSRNMQKSTGPSP